MPTAAQGLTAASSDQQIRDAISKSISMLVDEGRSQEQAIAIAYSQAEEATGRKLSRRSTRLGR